MDKVKHFKFDRTTHMDYFSRLTTSPELLLGKPVRKNTRIMIDSMRNRLIVVITR